MTVARRFFLALSLANLCYTPIWKRLLGLRANDEFGLKNLPGTGEYAAAMLGVVIWAAVFVSIDALLRRGPRFLRKLEILGGLSLLLLPAQSLLAGSPLRDSLMAAVHTPLLLIFVGLAVAALILFARYPRPFMQGIAALLLACTAFCAFTFGSSLYRMTKPKTLADGRLASRLPHVGTTRRVLWLIFDEWDQRLTFDARPAGLELPAIDRLRRGSLHAEHALPPSDATVLSMASLIEGRTVHTAIPMNADTLTLTYQDGLTQRFGDEPNLFSEAHRAGMNAAAFGWALPYCRLLSQYLVDCWWQEMDAAWNSGGATFGSALVTQPRSLVETAIYSPFGQSLTTLKHRRTYEELLEHAKNVSCDPEIQIALVHFDVPHPPYFYDRATGRLTRANSRFAYTDALALVDRTIDELRSEMERAGTWDTTTLLASADHFYRVSPLVNGVRDQRVPFLLHIARQQTGVAYDREFHTVLTHDLILALLRGEIPDAASARRWLDGHNQ